MGQIVPDAVEQYLAGLNHAGDQLLDDIARGNATRGLPLVDAEVGALLRVLATSIGASRILEIGTAIGYSGIWLAGALPAGGMLVTLELDEGRAREARDNFARAGVSDRVSVVVGDALVVFDDRARLVWILAWRFMKAGYDLAGPQHVIRDEQTAGPEQGDESVEQRRVELLGPILENEIEWP